MRAGRSRRASTFPSPRVDFAASQSMTANYNFERERKCSSRCFNLPSHFLPCTDRPKRLGQGTSPFQARNCHHPQITTRPFALGISLHPRTACLLSFQDTTPLGLLLAAWEQAIFVEEEAMGWGLPERLLEPQALRLFSIMSGCFVKRVLKAVEKYGGI